MDAGDVVTCFLRHRGAVLLQCRAQNGRDHGSVSDGAGLWDAITATVDDEADDPEAVARAAIADACGGESSVAEAVTLRRRGDPVALGERADETDRRVPVLFDCDERPTLAEEGRAREWASPPAILRRETVPGLWAAYDRVRPRVATVRDDRERGSAALSWCALAVLRDEAATAASDDWDALADLARALLAARPSMAVVANRVNRAMDEASDDRTPAAVEAAACREIDRAGRADERAARAAADRLPDRVATLSRSGTVLAAIREASPEAVLVAESRPGREGVGLAATLAEEQAEAGRDDPTEEPAASGPPAVTVTTDAALADRLAAWDAGALVVGADRILPDGRVVNKVGTRGAALATPPDCPCYVVTASDTVAVDDAVDREERSATEVYEGAAPVAVANPTFDVTPGDAVEAVLTEQGVLDAEGIAEVATRHRSRADWA